MLLLGPTLTILVDVIDVRGVPPTVVVGDDDDDGDATPWTGLLPPETWVGDVAPTSEHDDDENDNDEDDAGMMITGGVVGSC